MRSTHLPSVHRQGFSLVELLVVILIIAILMGLTVMGARYAMLKGYSSKTAIQLKVLETGLEKFQTDRMEYPNPSTGGSKVLYIALSGDGIAASDLPPNKPTYAGTPDGKIDNDNERKWSTYIEELLAPGGNKSLQKWVDPTSGYKIKDGFGEEIQYRCQVPAQASQQNSSYDLWSYGTDTSSAKNQQAKWIKNW